MARFKSGWVKLWRSLDDHPAADDAVSLGLMAWLMMNANREPSRCKFAGKLTDIKPGQLVTGTTEMAERLVMSRSTLRRRLEWFEKCGSIVQQVTSHGRIITLVNWADYQGSEDELEQPTANQRPTNGQPTANQRPLNGEGEKERREEVYLTSESPDSGLPSPRDLAELWNTLRAPTQRAINQKTFKPTSKRWTWAKARLAEHPDLAYWREVVERIAASSFCRGDGGTAWTADFDFLVRRDTHLKTMEGKYDDRGAAGDGDSDAYWAGVENLVRAQEAKNAAKGAGP